MEKIHTNTGLINVWFDMHSLGENVSDIFWGYAHPYFKWIFVKVRLWFNPTQSTCLTPSCSDRYVMGVTQV